MPRCRPSQHCLILRSINGNKGKIIKTVRNEGWQVFRRQNPETGEWYPLRKPNVWSVEAISSPLVSNAATAKLLCERFGPTVSGLFADEDLLPLNNPDLEDEIVNELFIETRAALDEFESKQRKAKS